MSCLLGRHLRLSLRWLQYYLTLLLLASLFPMGSQHSSRPYIGLYLAARLGDRERIRTLLDEAGDQNNRRWLLEWEDRQGRTPLIIAAQKGHLACVLELLRSGANVHHISRRDFGGTALHEASYYKWRSQGIVEALLRHGANPFARNRHNRTALDLALIENAPRNIASPWLLAFDRYGYYAKALRVRTPITTLETDWIPRWVTVTPLYASSDPSQMRCLRKTLVVYADCYERVVISSIDLTNATTILDQDSLEIRLGEGQPQPAGVASAKIGIARWGIFLRAVFNGAEDLADLAVVVSEVTQTIIERQLHQADQPAVENNTGSNQSNERQIPEEAAVIDATHEAGSNVARFPVIDATAMSHEVVAVYRDGETDYNSGLCILCLDQPQTAGFLHGNSVHRCVCNSCAWQISRSNITHCPICRQAIERIITGDY